MGDALGNQSACSVQQNDRIELEMWGPEFWARFFFAGVLARVHTSIISVPTDHLRLNEGSGKAEELCIRERIQIKDSVLEGCELQQKLNLALWGTSIRAEKVSRDDL